MSLLDSTTENKAQGHIFKDGVIDVQELNDFEAFLKNVHQKTHKDYSETDISWSEGASKSHVNVYGTDYSSKDGSFYAFIQAAGKVLSTANVHRLNGLSDEMMSSPEHFEQSYEVVLNRVDELMGKDLGIVDKIFGEL